MTKQEFDRFLQNGPNVLVAPAGYGKTHTIAKAVNWLHTNEPCKILVLTHTNAGITSIKEKFKKEEVSTKGVSIYTIAGFLQKIVHFLSSTTIQEEADSNLFYQRLYEEALTIFNSNRVLRKVIETSFQHVFIDEFQDCNRVQYKIAGIMSRWNIKVHFLLDPLQTIFNFEDNHPDYLRWVEDCKTKSKDRVFELRTPYRWRNAKSSLERHVPVWRETILTAITNQTFNVDVSKFRGASYFDMEFGQFYRYLSRETSKPGNILVLHSLSKKGNVEARGNVAQKTGYKLRLIESVDNPDFYTTAEEIDRALDRDDSIEEILCMILEKCKISSSNIDKWIRNNHLVEKKDQIDATRANQLKKAISASSRNLAIAQGLEVITDVIGLKVQRVELLSEIKKALYSSFASNRSIKEEIELKRNLARIQGRKIHGKVIGTTLLTKGLESDTVILLKPKELLKDRDGLMHLYVAMTRAVNELIMIDIH